jgi:hypothetical protein
LFHEFVIEKSRGIYEKMLEDDLKDLEVDEGSHDKDKKDEKKKKDDKDMKEESDESEESVEEASKEDEEVEEASKDEEVDEASDEETDENMEITPEADPMGGDAADDMIDDMEDGDEGDMEKDDDAEDMEDRVVDLEDALDDLKAEFEKMMADKEGGDDMDDEDAPDMDMGDEEKEDEAIMPASDLSMEQPVADEMPFEGKKSDTEQMREYVEKVATPKGEDNKAKSPVASANKMGGTASNLNAGGEGDTKGSAMSAKEDNAGNVNVPGAKASKSMSNAKGHGAEKKGAGETGADTKSVVGS